MSGFFKYDDSQPRDPSGRWSGGGSGGSSGGRSSGGKPSPKEPVKSVIQSYDPQESVRSARSQGLKASIDSDGDVKISGSRSKVEAFLRNHYDQDDEEFVQGQIIRG